jgi:hypothetical protein
VIDWLIQRAKRTPYYHLDGYMNRWWLVPYRQVIARTVPIGTVPLRPLKTEVTDGTGPVSFWRRPLAWLLQRFDIAVRVHEILRSDEGRDPHDHPWPYVTIVLRGGYIEDVFDAAGKLIDCKWHGPGSILYRPAGTWHMLWLPDGTTATTLFITGKKAQTWGFNVNGTKVPYRDYLSAR